MIVAQRKASIAHTILEIIDEDIIDHFCIDCPAAEGESCPADWMPSESKCVKNREYGEIEAHLKSIEDILEGAREGAGVA
jgi:hypothetical protein